MQWVVDNWHSISLVLAIILPLVLKVPFVEHSTLAEVLIKAFIFVLPKDPSNAPQSAKASEVDLNPKK